MPVPITSKFTTGFYLKAIFFSLYLLISTLLCINVSIAKWTSYTWGHLLLIGVYSVFLIIIYVYLSIKTLVKITAAPEGIILYYLITKKKIVIDYADIVHVSNLITNADHYNFLIPIGLKLVIELSTGEQLSFTDDQFTNYEELKDAIREYRFHLK